MSSPGINGQGAQVYFGLTKGAAIPTTAVTKASPAIVTATNTLAGGDIIVCSAMLGMTELVGRAFVVGTTGTSGSAIALFSEDATGYVAVGTVGNFNKWTMTARVGCDMFKDASSGGSQNNKLDITTLTSTFKEYVAGLPDSPVLSFNLYPGSTRDATFVWLRKCQKLRTIIPIYVKVPNPDTTAVTESMWFHFVAVGFITNFVEMTIGVDQPYAASIQFQTTGGLEMY